MRRNPQQVVTIETIPPGRVNRTARCMNKTKKSGRQTADALHLDKFVPYRLSVLSNTVSMSLARAYAREFNLSIPEWRVIAVLARYPDLSAVEVAERTAMDKVAVSRAVQSLLRSKRLARSYDREDRRRSVLRLSTSGRSVYTRIAPLALQYEHKLLVSLTASERRSLDRLMATLLKRAQLMN